MFAVPYPRGKIHPITAPNGDPGRVRVTELLAATYGNGEAAVRRRLVTVSLLDHPIRVHELVAPALQRVNAKLGPLLERQPAWRPLFAKPGGGFVYREIAGTDRLSGHAFGIAVDLDPSHGAYHRWDDGSRWRNEVPQEIVDIFESEGFIWGGRWYHYDTMHFEYRPELLADGCFSR
jgi:hypothetical protein